MYPEWTRSLSAQIWTRFCSVTGPPFAALGPVADVADMGAGEPVWATAASAAMECMSARRRSRSDL
jgi:hypothetical protein